MLSVRYNVYGKNGKTIMPSNRLPEKGETSTLQTGKLCYNAININSLVLVCVCVCAELQESLISSRSLTPLYRFLQSIDRIINDEGNTNTKTLMQCEKFSSHPNLVIKMLTGKKFFFPRLQQYTWAYVHNYLDATLLVCTVQLSYYEVPKGIMCLFLWG